MYKVDIMSGNDENDNSYGSIFQTLGKAIEVSKTGDTIMLLPGTHDSVEVSSRTTHFELKIKGTGNNTICSRFSFNGFLDLTFEDILIESIDIISSSSNFHFKNVKFAGMHVMNIRKYENNLGDEHRTCFIFEDCKFERNFQMRYEGGNHIISIKSCEIRGQLPLILCKKTGATIKLTNVNFDDSILLNNDSYVDVQHTGCNFTCPLYKGKETLVYTKDNYVSPSIDGLQYGSPYIFKEKLNFDKGDVNNESVKFCDKVHLSDEVEIYGGIEIDSSEFRSLNVHRVTEFIRVIGSNSVELILPRNPINGHLLEIYTDSVIIINDVEYHNRLIRIRWTANGGYFFYPTDPKIKLQSVLKKQSNVCDHSEDD